MAQDDLWPLERAVLAAIARQAVGSPTPLALNDLRVSARENTGAGFYTTFEAGLAPVLDGVASPLGNVSTAVEGLEHGLGFLLWLKDGHAHELEGHAYGEDTSALDFATARFGDPCPAFDDP